MSASEWLDISRHAPRPFEGRDIDPIRLLLEDKRSPRTKQAYRADLTHFFEGDPAPERVRAFLAAPVPEKALRLATYKAQMMSAGLSEATVNRRLAAVRSLLKIAFRLGLSNSDGGSLVSSERVRPYRDTRGLNLQQLQQLVNAPDRYTLGGWRDTALLRLLCENALRRAEVCALDVQDFDAGERRLQVHGKGYGSQQVPVTLSPRCTEMLTQYLHRAGHRGGALFRNLDHRTHITGARLTPDGVYYLVRTYGERIGVANLTPHKLRHSAITAALDATSGDVRRVQRFSRHADLNTLRRYDDNRTDLQGEVTTLLSDLL